jgi:hypothetical protein
VRHSGIFIAVIDDALTSGTMVRFRAEGSSMYPAIRDGETITVVAVSPDEVVRGDVCFVLVRGFFDVVECPRHDGVVRNATPIDRGAHGTPDGGRRANTSVRRGAAPLN